jgi:nickel-dependent lactate racemase
MIPGPTPLRTSDSAHERFQVNPMICKLAYGAGRELRLDVEEHSLAAYFPHPRGEPLADPAAELRKALQAPLGSPPLGRYTVPGDRIVVAVDHGVPQTARLVAAIVDEFAAVGVAGDQIEVLQADPPGVASDFEPATVGAGRVTRHDPDHRETVGFLAATKEGQPIYLNRDLLEADLVIWLGQAVPSSAPRWHGVSRDLYPTFSDAASQRRFLAAGLRARREEFDRRRQEAAEAAWLAGALFRVAVVPGPEQSILHVIAGDSATVTREGGRLAEASWSFQAPRRVDLAVVAIPGGGPEQSWAHVGRAAAIASRIVADEGAIVVCSELADPPGQAVQLLGDQNDPEVVLRAVRASDAADAMAAFELARARRKAHVFLLSQLDSEVVEGLGLAPAEQPEDVERLAARRESVALVGGGQFATLSLAHENQA